MMSQASPPGAPERPEGRACAADVPPEVVEALHAHLTESVVLVRKEGIVAHVAPPGGLLGLWAGPSSDPLRSVHDDDKAALQASASTVLAGGPGTQITVLARLRSADGEWGAYELTIVNRRDDPTLDGLVVRTQALPERGVEASEVRLAPVVRAVIDAMPSGLVLLDRHGRVLYSNRIASDLLGIPVDQPAPVQLSGSLRGEDRSVLDAAIRLASEQPDDLELSVDAPTPDGERRVRVRITSRAEDDVVTTILAVLEDVTEQHRRESDLRHRASHDPLTGLPNRREVHEVLGRDVLADPEGQVVVYCDLDGFKDVNDRYGHDGGDAVLVEVAAALRAAVRAGDIVGRVGGDEFVVLCRGTGDTAAAVLARRLSNLALRPEGAPDCSLSFSVGWSRGEPGDTARSLLGRADAAMYAVKRARRSR